MIWESWATLTTADRINIGIALVTAIAAGASWAAASASKKAVLSPIMMQIRDSYTRISPGIADLAEFFKDNDYNEHLTIENFHRLKDQRVVNSYTNRLRYHELDEARRQTSQHFLNIMILSQTGFISATFLTQAVQRDEVRSFLILLPIFEKAINPNFSPDIFHFYLGVYKFTPSELVPRQLGPTL